VIVKEFVNRSRDQILHDHFIQLQVQEVTLSWNIWIFREIHNFLHKKTADSQCYEHR